MNPAPSSAEHTLSAKIARLVQERGWNQEDFSRIANINRHTARQILQQGHARKLRNATVLACARALGLTVSELRSLPLERLLPRMHGTPPGEDDDKFQRLYDLGTQPELKAWLERNAERARRFSMAEVNELLSLQGPNDPLAKFGVEHFVDLMERRRALRAKVEIIAGTEYLPFLEQFVGLLYEKVEPPAERK
ncbi:MAG TPA: helix-turn-helix transcriptional regulator [Gemmataceae bacterium]|jgi:transcriptional regulator with XRE-family HTH domain|nr:helix-turn-helix transcriptional regulator [Gemmataceae bacterium]